jgi:2'-5' RNA ligase
MRLFVALWPPADVVAQLGTVLAEVAGKAAPGPGVRWSGAGQLHLTVAFLGEVDDLHRSRVEQRLARVATRYPPLTLRLDGAGRFGDRVLYLRVAGDREGLGRLAASVAAAARRAGVRLEERAFRAHLTLARGRAGADLRPLVAALDGYRSAGWTAAELHLVRSRLGGGEGGRAAYDTVAAWPLTGPESR